MMNDDSKILAADIDDEIVDEFDHDEPVIEERAERPSSGMRKLLLPAVALVTVAGVGGYLALNMPSRTVLQSAMNTSAIDAAPQVTETAAVPGEIPEMIETANAVTEVQPSERDLTEPVAALAEPAVPDIAEEPAIIPTEAETQNTADASAPLTQELTELTDIAPAAGDEKMVVAQAEDPVPVEAVPTEPQVLGMPTTMQADPIVPVMPEPVTEVPGQVPVPDEALQQPVPTEQGLPGEVTGDVTSSGITSPAQKDGPDTYYDSRLNVPTGPMADTVGPRKVDPSVEPASKYVIARKTYNANDSESMIVSANRALALGRNESALEMFNQMYEKNNRDPRILMGRAIAQQHLGMDDLAILSYEELLEIAPENTEAVVNLMGLIQKQYPAVALRRLADLQQKHPDNAGIAAQIGMAHAQAGDNKEALRSLGTAASIEPTNALHFFNMAVVSDRMGNKSQAINYYEQALEKDSVYGGGRSVPREKIYDRLSRLRGH